MGNYDYSDIQSEWKGFRKKRSYSQTEIKYQLFQQSIGERKDN